MTLFYLLYLALLVAWVLLVWPAFRTRGAVRIGLAFVILAGIAALLHEIRIFLFASQAIRIDIFLISPALIVLYGGAIIALLVARWPRLAAMLGVVLLVIGAGMSLEWIKLQRESARLTELFHERNALLFDAKFRDRQTYQAYFGPLDSDGSPFPVGHWRPDEGYYKRLIVNANGDVWLFYGCGETECALRSGKAGLPPAAGDWQAELTPPSGLPMKVTITRQGADILSLAAGERQFSFRATPPPVGSGPAAKELTYLGAFAHAACRRQHSDVRQVWLWRQGERLFAVAIMSPLVAGRTNRFVEPLYLGEGKRQGEAWRFTWERHARIWEALLTPADGSVSLNLKRNDQEAVQIILDKKAIVEDEMIALAPLSSAADWQHWFEVIRVGHFSTAEVPDCG